MKIAYFAPIPFDGLKQRPQYLAEGLARTHEVIYVDPTVSIIKYLVKGGERPVGFYRKVDSGLTVCRLDGQWSLHRSMEGLWGGFGFPERRQLKKLLQDVDLVWIGFAPWYSLLSFFPGKVVYDWMDDNVQLTTNRLMRRLIFRTEPALLWRADHLFVTAQELYRQATERGLHPTLIPNAVERKQALGRWQAAFSPEPGARIFGYVGMISHWFDLNAVQTILDAAPENHVVLVGPEEIARLENPRVRYVGQVPKEQVGQWIASFDVCLYPFRHGTLLDTINPVKLYEYLAQNKPVLAVRSQETDLFGKLIYSYDAEEEIKGYASQMLSPPFQNDEERLQFVTQNTWDSRVELILKKLQNGSSGR